MTTFIEDKEADRLADYEAVSRSNARVNKLEKEHDAEVQAQREKEQEQIDARRAGEEELKRNEEEQRLAAVEKAREVAMAYQGTDSTEANALASAAEIMPLSEYQEEKDSALRLATAIKVSKPDVQRVRLLAEDEVSEFEEVRGYGFTDFMNQLLEKQNEGYTLAKQPLTGWDSRGCKQSGEEIVCDVAGTVYKVELKRTDEAVKLAKSEAADRAELAYREERKEAEKDRVIRLGKLVEAHKVWKPFLERVEAEEAQRKEREEAQAERVNGILEKAAK